ncbi:MAG: PilN domain-containing protein [Geminocystis sp.]|nr:PilN domain-containing protein [Geminocystis sp.]MCS7147423.1 PilN domain-containing protein [Geminocystis sp.]MDW8117156.1 PilN domain-containing protein [Geminocystis sp.]MDW8462589.1 PilN domain-containing protein [Geminocystis sp.]
MYIIDINFLRDRKAETITTTAFKKKSDTTIKEQLPILIGGGVGLACIALTGGIILVLEQQKTATKNVIDQLDAEIQKLTGQSQEAKQIETEIENVNREIGTLVSVFNNIRPWSAILDEISTLTPPGIQLNSISQTEGKKLTINGNALSYQQVSDFFVGLKYSPFFKQENTKLVTASLGNNPNASEASGGSGGSQGATQPQQVVLFTINTEIGDKPAAELLSRLERRGAIGLVSRISALKRRGLLQKATPIVQTGDNKEGEGQK